MKDSKKNFFEDKFLGSSQSGREIIAKIDAKNYLNLKPKGGSENSGRRKELYMYAAARGKEHKGTLTQRKDMVRSEYYKGEMEYITMLLALSIKEIKRNGKSIEESLYDKNIVLNADAFAETGLICIKDELEKYVVENSEYEKIELLDELYEKYVNED